MAVSVCEGMLWNFKGVFFGVSVQRYNNFTTIDTNPVSNPSCVHIDHRKTIYYHFSQARAWEFYCDSTSCFGDFNHIYVVPSNYNPNNTY